MHNKPSLLGSLYKPKYILMAVPALAAKVDLGQTHVVCLFYDPGTRCEGDSITRLFGIIVEITVTVFTE